MPIRVKIKTVQQQPKLYTIKCTVSCTVH